jgi:hypothetical protein
MSATDEELQYVHEGGMDHVTYILIMFRYGIPNTLCRHLPHTPSFLFLSLFPFSSFCIFHTTNPQSIAFLLYTHIVFLITLYATSGRNASDAAAAAASMTKYGGGGGRARARAHAPGAIELTATRTASRGAWYSRVRTEDPMHVIGEEDEDED